MADKIIKTIFQFKRGTAEKWSELNPILGAGEPGVAIDTGEFKIGDGVTPWNQLAPTNEEYVVNKATHFEFPSIGKSNAIYKASEECMLYQWNEESLKYEPLTCEVLAENLKVDIICGGNAKDVTANS